ncbi:MAG TPA: flagellar biosynthetic protein FliO [Clostridiaceae bacterium]|nr:flagellar biosynthetic protein FliO [Clostridiaceae bacterium]
MDWGDILAAFLYILVLGVIIFLAYMYTKYIGKKAGRLFQGKYINIVETISLGGDKRIHLVKVGEEFFLISSTAKDVNFLTGLKLNELAAAEGEEEVKKENTFSFNAILNRYINLSKENISQAKKPDESTQKKNIFKDNLRKLQSLTNKNELSGDENIKNEIEKSD